MAQEEAPPSGGPRSTGPNSGGWYEFDAKQNKTIGGLATALSALGLFFLVYGILNGLSALDLLRGRAFITGGRTLLEAALYVTMSRFFRAGGKALDAVVDTRGNDIPNLMSGLGVVRKAIVLWGWAMFGLLTVQLVYLGVYFAARRFGLQLPGR
jgi:hypothetical protein